MSQSRREPSRTSSSRLRSVFFRLWETDKEGYEVFDDYYKVKMNKVINHYKTILSNKR